MQGFFTNANLQNCSGAGGAVLQGVVTGGCGEYPVIAETEI